MVSLIFTVGLRKTVDEMANWQNVCSAQMKPQKLNIKVSPNLSVSLFPLSSQIRVFDFLLGLVQTVDDKILSLWNTNLAYFALKNSVTDALWHFFRRYMKIPNSIPHKNPEWQKFPKHLEAGVLTYWLKSQRHYCERPAKNPSCVCTTNRCIHTTW